MVRIHPLGITPNSPWFRGSTRALELIAAAVIFAVGLGGLARIATSTGPGRATRLGPGLDHSMDRRQASGQDLVDTAP